MSPTIRTLFVIGDSISVGYTPHLAAICEPRGVAVVHSEGNTGDSSNTLKRLEEYLTASAGAELITLNVGLHDLRRFPDGRHQVELEDYRRNLEAIVQRLRQAGRKFVWVTTTPVRDQLFANNPKMTFERYNTDVQAYNGAAAEVMAAAGVGSIDLYQAVMEAGRDACLLPDGVHMTDEGYRLLAEKLAAEIG